MNVLATQQVESSIRNTAGGRSYVYCRGVLLCGLIATVAAASASSALARDFGRHGGSGFTAARSQSIMGAARFSAASNEKMMSNGPSFRSFNRVIHTESTPAYVHANRFDLQTKQRKITSFESKSSLGSLDTRFKSFDRMQSNRRTLRLSKKLTGLGSVKDNGDQSQIGNLKLKGSIPLTGVANQSHDQRFGKTKIGKLGDLHSSRQGDLAKKFSHDWSLQKKPGRMSAEFTKRCFGDKYCGPKGYPHKCWYPKYCDWVKWCWWDHCHSYCDPRPYPCRPIYCDPCGPWVSWDYPVWTPLPVVLCGTWIDVPVVAVSGLDLQLLAVRFVDGGHPEKKLGPRYRVWLRNNSITAIDEPFSVHVMAAASAQPVFGMPAAGVGVRRMEAGQTTSVDIRLPLEAGALPSIHVLVDSGRTIEEVSEDNNGLVIARDQIQAIDPALFSVDRTTVATGEAINVAGEGLGPEPGRVLVSIGGLQIETEIEGWYDLGVRVKLPKLPISGAAEAQLTIVRGDGATTNSVKFKIAPVQLSEVQLSEAATATAAVE